MQAVLSLKNLNITWKREKISFFSSPFRMLSESHESDIPSVFRNRIVGLREKDGWLDGMYVCLSLVGLGRFPIDACDRVVEEAIYPSSFFGLKQISSPLFLRSMTSFQKIRKSCPRNLQKDGRRQMTSKRSVCCSLCIILSYGVGMFKHSTHF